MLIIIRGRNRMGRTRSEIEGNLRKEWGVSSLSDEQIDKAKHLERKYDEHFGSRENFVDTGEINKIK